MLAVVYSRVSSEDQARTGFSLAAQAEAGRRMAVDLGATEVTLCTDEGVPGDVLERPGLQQALALLRERPGACFICYDPDRLARSLSLQLLVTDQIERAGARLEFVNFDYRQTPEGQLFYSLRGAIAQYEKAKIRERTMRGKRQKARSGGLTHNPCIYGYHFDPVADQLTINSAAAPVVQQIFRWFLEDQLNPGAIARRLTALGVPPARGGPAWHHASVRNILHNRSYTGVLHLQKWDSTDARRNKYRPPGEKVARRLRPPSEWVELPIPPLIDAATYEMARRRLACTRRRRHGRSACADHLLGGIAACGLCGRPVYGLCRGRLRYYVCRGYAPGVAGQPRCAFGRVRAEPVDAAVQAHMGDLWRKVVRWPPAECPSGQARAEILLVRRRLQELEAAHRRTARLVAEGVVDPAAGEPLLQEQQTRLGQLREEIVRLQTRADLADGPLQEQPFCELAPACQQQIMRVLVRKAVLDPERQFIRLETRLPVGS